MKKAEILKRIEYDLVVDRAMIDVMRLEKEARVFAFNVQRGRGESFSRKLAKMAAENDEDEVLQALWKNGNIKAYVAVRTVTTTAVIPAFTREQAEEIMRNLDDASWESPEEERVLDNDTVVYEHKEDA